MARGRIELPTRGFSERARLVPCSAPLKITRAICAEHRNRRSRVGPSGTRRLEVPSHTTVCPILPKQYTGCLGAVIVVVPFSAPKVVGLGIVGGGKLWRLLSKRNDLTV